MEELLKKLGFTHVTATLWKHPGIPDMIHIPEHSTAIELPIHLFQHGRYDKAKEIRKALNVKE